MTETLSLMKFSANNFTTKEKIITLLSEYWPLSTKEIFARLKKEYSTELSYQSIHKTLQELEREKTIERTGKNWKIQKEWLLSGETFFQKSLERYNGAINRYDFKPGFEGTLTFKFDSFTELCVKTAELLASKILAKNGDNYFTCVMEYGWWPIKFRFEHLKLLYKLVKNCKHAKYIIRKKTPFGEFIHKQYRKVNGIGALLGTNIEIDEDIFIQGNYIIEVQISKEGKKIIEKYWNKWKNVNGVYLDFGLKEEPKIHSIVKITKNQKLAVFLQKELEKHFKEEE